MSTETNLQRWNEVIDGEEPERKVLVFYRNDFLKNRIVIAKYIGKFQEEQTDSDLIEYADYCEEKDAYFVPEGWYEVIDNWDEYSSVKISHRVTHFQSLPAYPRLEVKGE